VIAKRFTAMYFPFAALMAFRSGSSSGGKHIKPASTTGAFAGAWNRPLSKSGYLLGAAES